jgi:membrane-associated phospholipid phosphatase
MLLNTLLKHQFHRARPTVANPIVTLTSYSFPSGHTMAATCLYGALAAFAFSHLSSWRWRVAVISAAAILVSLVAFSRLYLGAHYLSDVLAAMAEGLAWLAFCLIAASLLRRHGFLKKANV